MANGPAVRESWYSQKKWEGCFFDIEYYFVLLVSKQFFVLINELEKILFDIEY